MEVVDLIKNRNGTQKMKEHSQNAKIALILDLAAVLSWGEKKHIGQCCWTMSKGVYTRVALHLIMARGYV